MEPVRCGDDATWPGCGRSIRAPETGPGETSSFYFSHRYSSRHEYSGRADRPRVIRGLFYRIKDLFYPFRQVGNVKGLGDVIENTFFDPGGDIVLLALGGKHDHRNAAGAPIILHLLEDLETAQDLGLQSSFCASESV